MHEIADILFSIKSIRNPPDSFNINKNITFYTGSSTCQKYTNYKIPMVPTFPDTNTA